MPADPIAGSPAWMSSSRLRGYGFNTGPGRTTADYVRQVITDVAGLPDGGRGDRPALPPERRPGDRRRVRPRLPLRSPALLEFTGPIDAEGVPYPLDASNTEKFLNVDQYIVVPDGPGAWRVDAPRGGGIDGRSTRRCSARASRPGGARQDDSARSVREHHVAGWLRDPRSKTSAHTAELDHVALPPTGRVTWRWPSTTAAAARSTPTPFVSVDLTSAVDATGQLTGTVDVTIRNTAPATGLPTYVIGNFSDEPEGTNILRQCVRPVCAHVDQRRRPPGRGPDRP